MDTLTLPPSALGAPAPARALGANAAGDAANLRRRGGPDAYVLGLTLLLMFAAILAAIGVASLARAHSLAVGGRYRTGTVTRGQVTGVLRVPARVVPRSTIRVGAQRVGRVTAVLVAAGQSVRRGQALARLDDREQRAIAQGARAAVLAAEVNAHQAQMRLAQIVYLLQRGTGDTESGDDSGDEAISSNELNAAALEAEVTLVNAAAELKKQAAAALAARASLAAAILTAPIDGMVLSRNVEPGDTVGAGVPLFLIGDDPSELQVVAALGEGDVARVRPGQITFEVPALPARVFRANLGAVEPSLASPDGVGAHGYHVRLSAANRALELRPGMTATVSVPLSSAREALQVPVEALHVSNGKEGEERSAIYVLDAARQPQRIPVEVGVTDGHVVEVRAAALQPGTRVVVGEGRSRTD